MIPIRILLGSYNDPTRVRWESYGNPIYNLIPIKNLLERD